MQSFLNKYNFILIPAMLSILFFSIAFTPVSVLGCSARGLLAFGVALLCGISALIIAVLEIINRRKGLPDNINRMMSVMILIIPLLYIYFTEF